MSTVQYVMGIFHIVCLWTWENDGEPHWGLNTCIEGRKQRGLTSLNTHQMWVFQTRVIHAYSSNRNCG